MKGKEENLEIGYKIWIESEKGPLIGEGGAELLKLIKKRGSIKKAAEKMEWSYKFAWSYINHLQERSPQPVVESFKGGKEGGGTRLTLWGEQLIELYEAAHETVKGGLADLERKILKDCEQSKEKSLKDSFDD